MTANLTTTAVSLSPPAEAVDRQSWRRFPGVMRVVRDCLVGGKYETRVSDLVDALQISRRTAERIIAGQDVSGDTTLSVLTHDVFGPPFLEALLVRIPIERRAGLAKSLREAAELVRLRAEQETIAQQIAEREAGR